MRVLAPVLGLALAGACLALAGLASAVDVRMAGDSRVFGLFFANRDFTSLDRGDSRLREPFTVWQRLRVRADFVASDNLSFRLGLRLDDEAWGSGYLTAANPAVAAQAYLAFLKFTLPDTRVQVTAGYQPISAPQTEAFYDSVVLAGNDGDQSTAALAVSMPVIDDTLALNAAFGRLLAANRTFQPTTSQSDDTFDLTLVTLPVTAEGMTVTPWGMGGVYGRSSDPAGLLTPGLAAAGRFLSPTGYALNQNFFWWAGGSLAVDLPGDWHLYADAIYGAAGTADRPRSRRRGYFADAAVRYTGFARVTPSAYAWIGSGEDKSIANGSERLPVVAPAWGPGTSFLFNCDQSFAVNNMNMDPTGTVGLAVGAKDIALVRDISSRLTAALAMGRNSRAGLRQAVALAGEGGGFVRMGQTLADGEWVLGVNLDHFYHLTDGLTLALESGWATGQGFKPGIWGHSAVHAAKDAWMLALGFVYQF